MHNIAGRRGDAGATLVEYAVVAPLLFLLLFGLIEFGRAVVTFTGVQTAAREAARYGTTVGESPDTPGLLRYLDCDGMRDAARAKAVMVNLDDSDITITYDTGPGSPPTVIADCQGGTAPTEDLIVSGSRIVVRVETQFQSPIPIISNFIGTMDVEGEQARTLFKGEISG